jgi:hypothetical protein
MEKLIYIIRDLIKNKFTGSLVVHFFKGGIAKAKSHVEEDLI